MAIIECTECGHKFSEKAHACPNCGCPTIDILAARNAQAEKELENRRKEAKERVLQHKEESRRAKKELDNRRRAKKEFDKKQRKIRRVERLANPTYRFFRGLGIAILVLACLVVLGFVGYRIYKAVTTTHAEKTMSVKSELSKEHIILAEYDAQKIVYGDMIAQTNHFAPTIHVYDMKTKSTKDYQLAAGEDVPMVDYFTTAKLIGNRFCVIGRNEDNKNHIWASQLFMIDMDLDSLVFVDYGRRANLDDANGTITISKNISERDTAGKILEYTNPYYSVTYSAGASYKSLNKLIDQETENNKIIVEVYKRHYVCPQWVYKTWYMDIMDKGENRIAEKSFKFDENFCYTYIDKQLLSIKQFNYCDETLTLEDGETFGINKEDQSMSCQDKTLNKESNGPVMGRMGDIRFAERDDVLAYTDKRTFTNASGEEISFKLDGMYSGENLMSQEVSVENFDSTMAVVRVVLYGQSERYLIDAGHGRIWLANETFYNEK